MNQELKAFIGMRDRILKKLLQAGARIVCATYEGSDGYGGLQNVEVSDESGKNILTTFDTSFLEELSLFMKDAFKESELGDYHGYGCDGSVTWRLTEGDFGKIEVVCNTNVMTQETNTVEGWDALIGEPDAVQAEG